MSPAEYNNKDVDISPKTLNDKNQLRLITLVYKEIEASTKITVFTSFECAELKFEIHFYSSPLVFQICIVCILCIYGT